jgi:putative spermidine/putrescine transport system permease protein
MMKKISPWIVLGLFCFLFLIPFLFIVLSGFSGAWKFPSVFPSEYSLRGLNYLISNAGKLFQSSLNSIFFSLSTVILSIILSFLPASVLARDSFRFKSVIESLLLAPVLLPSITFAMGLHIIFIRLGLSDSFLGVTLILTLFSYPYMLRALITGFMTLPIEMEIASTNLGASKLRTFFTIQLPLLIPAMISGGSVVFLAAFSNYFLIFLIGGGNVPSLTGYLFPFINSGDRPISSLLTVVFVLIPVLLFLMLEAFMQIEYRRKGLN